MSEPEGWRGGVQREQLRGFKRLRAILWSRSVKLWEAWSLTREGWYWSTVWQKQKAFAGISLYDRARVSGDEDIFGETPYLTTIRLLDICTGLNPGHPRCFVDLGSGNGTPCFAASHRGYQAYGYEKEQAWVDACNRVADSLKLNCEFKCVDFLLEDWASPAIYFVTGTAFCTELKARLWERFCSLQPGSLLILAGWEPPEEGEVLWKGRLPVYWGVIDFCILAS